jgi:hypothetical protein
MSDNVARLPGLGDRVCRRRENRPVIVKEHEQVRGPVVIDIDNGSNMFVSRCVELFHQIDLIIEIQIRFTSDEPPLVVILLDVGMAVEIGVDRCFGGPSLIVVVTPNIRPTVAITVFCSNVSSTRPDGGGHNGRTGNRAQRGDARGQQALHVKPSD